MKIEKRARIIIALFIIMLVLPSITYPFAKKYLDTQNYENRELNQRPTLDHTNYLEFPNLYQSYYDDHVPYKNQLIKLKNYIDINIFHTLDHPSVILGKDKWLFYKGEGGIAIDEYRAEHLYTEEQLAQILNNVLRYKESIEKTTGSEFILMLIPDKEHIYGEFLPDYVKAKSNYKRIDQIYEYITTNSDIKVCYPLASLLAAKKINQIYYKYDTHWNNVGAYFGAKDLLELLEMFNDQSDKEKFIETSKVSGDLAGMLYLTNYYHDDIEYSIENYMNDILIYEKGSGASAGLSKYTSTNKNGKSIYFIGDSFRTAIQPYIAKQFEKSTFVHRNNFNKEDYAQEKPDVVVYQIVERYGNSLFSLKY